MAKSRKKKNNKLRRRVMRTVAALTMIMAIVVAAIPVENLDIVRADYANTLTINYASDVAGANNNSDLYTANSYENSYGGDQLRIQRIEGSMITELFTVQKSGTNADTAMITVSLLASGTNSLDIRNEEYYQYIQFDNTFVSAFRAAVGSLAYTYTYQATPQTFNGGTDSTGNNVSGSITINILSTASPTGNSNNAGTGSIAATTDDGGYTRYNLSNLTADTVYTSSYTSNIRTAQENLIRTYNTMAQQDIATLQAIQNKVSSSGNGSGTLTDTDRNNWANLQAKYASGQGATDYNAAHMLNVSFSNLGGTTQTASLTNFEKDLICKCFYNSSNNSLTLDRYELIEISKGQSSVYVPRLTGSNAALTGQSVDTNKYLVSGRARIDGIKSNAFVGAGINTLNIASNIRFIGADAFAGSPLRTVTIDMTNCEIIGDRAFKGCTNLTNVSFTGTYTGTASKLQEIGKEAFADTALSAITIPNSVGTIGAGGFANNAQLSRVEFASGGTNTAMTMQPYAFFNATNLSSVVFPSGTNNRQFQIMKFGFALDAGTNGGSLSDFTFPASNNSVNYGSEADYDYILANRSRLQTVTWPGLLQNKIPDNTLWGCEELSYTRFPDGAARADYTADALFQGVQNTDFYVEGPANINAQTVATPRETTWTAKAGYDNRNGIIPSKFTDSTGTHFEIGVKENPADTEPKYIATIDVTNEAAKEATLSKYTAYTTPNANDRFSIVIPDKVGEYTVVAIGPNCFDDDIKNKIYELIIKDGSVRQIAAEAFKGSENLQWVEIGDAVASIGREAFADCPKLENVVFSQTQTAGFYGQDAYWKDQHVLGTDAFKTGSTYLTFHGAIHPDYAPFALAMSADSKNMTSTRSECQICYKTDAPLNLTVIRDADGKATLIDYPHYEEVDYINKGLIDEYETETNEPNFSIKDRFELVNEIGNNANNDNKAVPTWARDIVLQTLNMNLPKGIENIDSAKYFKDSKNSADFVYFNRIYKKNDPPYSTTKPPYEEDTQPRNVNIFGKAENESVNSLYSSYQYTPNDVPDDYVETVPGLFSGFFDESNLDAPADTNGNLMWNAYDGHSYTENNERGNDYLTSVQMPTVEEFPDYAFDSAENLKSLTIGSALDKVGIQPFRDCKSLFEINTGDSTKSAYDGNMLF
ncbi:MAG: leucine-rich repeat domain-containing protein, partial [Lachnospiraceae bacterium]|nr:leucine-rich repeat domain-containing protein [Lachnospiraceae bacterium]